MSLILDALKKLDREKASHRNGRVDIAAEILRPDLPRRSHKTFAYALGILLAALLAAAVTYSVMPKTAPPTGKAPVASELEVPRASISGPKMGRGPNEVARRPVPEKPSPGRKAPVETQKPVESNKPADVKARPVEPKPPAPLSTDASTEPEVISKEVPTLPEEIRKPTEQPPKKSPLTPASLRLTGIVWSEDPSKRLAVINGLVTTEGYVFEGAKVVEIHPDHVVLLLNDEPLKLSLNR